MVGNKILVNLNLKTDAAQNQILRKTGMFESTDLHTTQNVEFTLLLPYISKKTMYVEFVLLFQVYGNIYVNYCKLPGSTRCTTSGVT